MFTKLISKLQKIYRETKMICTIAVVGYIIGATVNDPAYRLSLSAKEAMFDLVENPQKGIGPREIAVIGLLKNGYYDEELASL